MPTSSTMFVSKVVIQTSVAFASLAPLRAYDLEKCLVDPQLHRTLLPQLEYSSREATASHFPLLDWSNINIPLEKLVEESNCASWGYPFIQSINSRGVHAVICNRSCSFFQPAMVGLFSVISHVVDLPAYD